MSGRPQLVRENAVIGTERDPFLQFYPPQIRQLLGKYGEQKLPRASVRPRHRYVGNKSPLL